MTATQSTGALSAKADASWSTLKGRIKASVFRLQVRIAKAERLGRKGKVKALQRLLTTSFYGKCLAVKRVTSSAGGKTPGIDNVTWKTDLQKMKAVKSLKRKGYKAQPLRRIYISKKSGKGQRPHAIPTLKLSSDASPTPHRPRAHCRRTSRSECLRFPYEEVDS